MRKIHGWTSEWRWFERNIYERKLNSKLQKSNIALTSIFKEHRFDLFFYQQRATNNAKLSMKYNYY